MSKLVLIVEDEVLALIELQNALEEAGFEAVPAANGKEALAALERLGDKLHGLVTDIRLGNGPNGWSIAKQCRVALHNVAVVYTSADSAEDWLSFGVPESVMIPKPYASAQVITALSQLLNEAGL